MPIRERLSYSLDRDSSLMPAVRTARYNCRNTFARLEVNAELLPGWRHNDLYRVGITLLRYKRRI